jgi:hypothetical protein
MEKLNQEEEEVVVVVAAAAVVVWTSRWLGKVLELKASTIKLIGYCELKHHKPWFHEEYSKLFDLRKLAPLQLLQNPSETNGDN